MRVGFRERGPQPLVQLPMAGQYQLGENMFLGRVVRAQGCRVDSYSIPPFVIPNERLIDSVSQLPESGCRQPSQTIGCLCRFPPFAVLAKEPE
jgi:hypothetical protein